MYMYSVLKNILAFALTLLHSERPKLYTILAFLRAIGLMKVSLRLDLNFLLGVLSKKFQISLLFNAYKWWYSILSLF